MNASFGRIKQRERSARRNSGVERRRRDPGDASRHADSRTSFDPLQGIATTTAIVILLFGCLIAYPSNRIALRTVSVATVVAMTTIYVFAPLPQADPIAMDRAFNGFSSGALVTIVCLMMLGHVLMANDA